jgi:hypothetical protein
VREVTGDEEKVQRDQIKADDKYRTRSMQGKQKIYASFWSGNLTEEAIWKTGLKWRIILKSMWDDVD